MAPKLSFCKILISFLIYRSFAFSIDFNYPAIFNFGDSNSDTGGYVAGVAYHLYPPNGQTYFNGPSGRFCDGRLLLDFLTEAMDLPLLNPYLDAIGTPSFAQGCNFAVCGSSILPAIATSPSPYTLGPQVAQFFRFKARVLELQATSNLAVQIISKNVLNSKTLNGSFSYAPIFRAAKRLNKYLPASDYFEKGLYMFDIGQNDITVALFRSSFGQVLAFNIPAILSNFEVEVKNLYEQGARNFWIHNTGPLGCTPFIIDQFGADPSNLDEVGCVIKHNHAVKYFNLQLQVLCSRLQGLYQDAKITFVDIFAIKHNLLVDYATLG
ncbi:hypothetical protein RJ639_036348 [Escallonia herrerae]|uniref:GDSL esterase/lipase n=1 Tax=Escallonia herrerae TaxID=1293975 RepID=A0AA89B7X3_9ASTE|nr:hypothetical protein RJ639_036348 [Escallonia herrerae]